MKGLTGVLDRFSEGLRVRKVLPSLLEEVRTGLLAWNVKLDFSLDERHPPSALHPAQRVLHRGHCHSPAIRIIGPAQPQTPVHYQGTTSKHAHAFG